MNMGSLLSLQQVKALLSQRAISDQHPWKTNDEQAVDAFYASVCAEVSHATGALSRIEWEHYGSGYASYIDAWFYKASPEFNVREPLCYGNEHTGLVLLLSRLSPYFVFMEGEKTWHARGGSSYMPESGMVDHLPTEAVAALACQVQPILERRGLVRAMRDDLMEPLPHDLQVPTLLARGGFKQFDAPFYWED